MPYTVPTGRLSMPRDALGPVLFSLNCFFFLYFISFVFSLPSALIIHLYMKLHCEIFMTAISELLWKRKRNDVSVEIQTGKDCGVAWILHHCRPSWHRLRGFFLIRFWKDKLALNFVVQESCWLIEHIITSMSLCVSVKWRFSDWGPPCALWSLPACRYPYAQFKATPTPSPTYCHSAFMTSGVSLLMAWILS